MGFKSQKKESNEEQVKVSYTCKVTRVYQLDEDKVLFDMNVNGIDIKGFTFIFYKNKEGKEGTMISRPSRKGSDGKYYDQVFFPINNQMKDEILNQIESLLR